MKREDLNPVRKGVWLYGEIPAEVWICRSDVRYGSGDADDSPEVANDMPGTWFYVWMTNASHDPASREFSSGVGAFESISAAVLHLEKLATQCQTRVVWEP